MQNTINPFAKPMYIMAKPIGATCNLACDYCYYLEKSNLHRNQQQVMSDQLLEKFIQEYIDSQTMPEILFTWHGGETLLRPLTFYQKAIELQKKYARGRIIDNCIQTNGTLLTDEWCRFFKENRFLVGVSIDGPQKFHDKYRRNRQGLPSFQDVIKGIKLLNKHEVEWNAMAVVNSYNVEYPLEFYRFFRDELSCRFLQFTPIIERIATRKDGLQLASLKDTDYLQLTSHSIPAQQWGTFLCTIFDEWIKRDVGSQFIQLFDATLANWVGESPGVCTLSKYCGHVGVLEFNGDVYSCDHFVFPEYKIGNIYQKSFIEMMYSEQQNQFGLSKSKTLPQQCQSCLYEFACHGECPKNRFIKTKENEPGLNYLCEGYYRFFDHVAPYMDFMKKEYLAGRSPGNVMNFKPDLK